MGLKLKDGSLFLFQGDSITDCGRDYGDPESLGQGYAAMTAGVLRALYPDKGLRFINRGISGNRVTHLRDRWDADTLAHRPDALSLLVGVNDTHLSVTDPAQSPSQAESQAMLRGLLERVRAQNPDTLLIMMEPFLIQSAHAGAAWIQTWAMDHAERVVRYREVALAFGAVYIPLHGLFAAAYSAARPPVFWAEDGVHPTTPGHRLITGALLKAVGAQV